MRKYTAFISYRHFSPDADIAKKLHTQIETFRIPAGLKSLLGRKNMGKVFRDQEELPLSSDLGDDIHHALKESEWLICVCSPKYLESKWCMEELRYFLSLGRRDHILTILADGEPKDAFPNELRFTYADGVQIEKEPLAADVRAESTEASLKKLSHEKLRILAPLLGVSYDDLRQRARRRKTRMITSVVAAVFVALSSFLGYSIFKNAQISERNRQITEQNEQIKEQNTRITEQNDRIEEQNNELQVRLSSALVDSSITKLNKHDVKGAKENALEALQSRDPQVYDHRAFKTLSDIMGIYYHNKIQSSVIYEQGLAIRSLRVTDDEKHALFTDYNGVLRCLELDGFALKWEIDTNDSYAEIYTHNTGERILYKTMNGLSCVAVSDGSLLWSYENQPGGENYIQALSKDGSIFAVADRFAVDEDDWDPALSIVFLDTENGSELGRTQMSIDGAPEYVTNHLISKPHSYAASFSNDNTLFSCALPAEDPDLESDVQEYEEEESGTTEVFTIKMETFTKKHVCSAPDLIYLHGIDVRSEDESVFLSGYSSSTENVYTILCTKNEKEEYVENKLLTNHLRRTEDGLGLYRLLTVNPDKDCFMLANEKRVIVFDDNRMFLYDRDGNSLVTSFAMMDRIINAYWDNKEETICGVCVSDGSFFSYDMTPGKEFEDAPTLYGFDQDSISCAEMINGGMLKNRETGMILTVGGENENCLLLTRFISDPDLTTVPFEFEEPEYIESVDYLKDQDSLLVFHDYQNVKRIDAGTGKVIKSAVFEDLDLYDPVVLDSETFLCSDQICKMNGTHRNYGEPISLENDTDENYPENHVILKDGSILSWSEIYVFTEEYEIKDEEGLFSMPPMIGVWKDGIPIPSMSDPGSGLLLYDYSNPDIYSSAPQTYYVSAGKNGLILGYGRRISQKDGRVGIDDENRLYFYDSFTDTIMEMENSFPSSGDIEAVLGNDRSIAAVAYDDGNLCIYDPAAGRTFVPQMHYYRDEISAMAFSDQDDFFVILTENGRLDVYETSSYTCVFSEINSMYHDYRESYGYGFKTLNVHRNTALNQLIVMAEDYAENQCVFLDMDSWTVAAEAENVYDLDLQEKEGATGKLYCADQDSGYFICPIRSSADMMTTGG